MKTSLKNAIPCLTAPSKAFRFGELFLLIKLLLLKLPPRKQSFFAFCWSSHRPFRNAACSGLQRPILLQQRLQLFALDHFFLEQDRRDLHDRIPPLRKDGPGRRMGVLDDGADVLVAVEALRGLLLVQQLLLERIVRVVAVHAGRAVSNRLVLLLRL